MTVKFDGSKFLAERRKKKISQALLAEKADTTIRYVRDLEHCKKQNPSAALLYRVSAVLELPMESLMTEEKEEE